MSMLNEADWQFGPVDYDPCDGHDHCDLCGVCGDENELVSEREVGVKSINECLPCRVQTIEEDTNALT